MKKMATFGRKVGSLQELKAMSVGWGETLPYVVIKEVVLNQFDFKIFCNNFFKDRPWISPEDGGKTIKGVRCIRVINEQTDEKILVNNEGYSYPRYTAIEK